MLTYLCIRAYMHAHAYNKNRNKCKFESVEGLEGRKRECDKIPFKLKSIFLKRPQIFPLALATV